MFENLKQEVCEANVALEEEGLVMLTWGNVSGFDRDKGIMIIKPSGVPYSELMPDAMVAVDIKGSVLEGELNPSSDTPIHLALYEAFPEICGVTHTHSTFATMFAQAGRGIPCLGTTHADHFYGEVPVTRSLTAEEVEDDYEPSNGNIIVERFTDLDPAEMPAVLVAHHGPFTWGRSATDSLKNSIALEEIAQIAWGTLSLSVSCPAMPQYLLDKHFLRKHGKDSYYGQNGRL